MKRAPFVLVLAVVSLLAACGTSTEVAEFEVAPVAAAEPTPLQEAPIDAAPDAAEGAEPTPIRVVTEADEPQEEAEPEPTPAPSAVEVTEQAEPEEAEEPEEPEEADEPEETDEVLVVDYSRRGQVIEVTDDASGQAFTRIDGALPAGGSVSYSFDVAAGQSVLLRQLGGCVFNGDNLLLAGLKGPRGVGGAVFFRSNNDGCVDSSRYTAEEAGTVTLTVDDVDPDVSGTFSFEVYDVTNEPTVQLAYGDKVEPNSPVPGAGVFEFPGAEDTYSFQVEAGDIYVIRQLGCDLQDTTIATLHYDGVGGGFSSFQNNCDASDRYEADSTGTVIIRAAAGSSHVGTGSYGFELVDLTAAETFVLQVGDIVGPDSPAPGAGHIEIAGEEDRYTLEMTEGQTVVLTQLGECDFENGTGPRMEIDGAGINTIYNFSDSNDGCFGVKRLTAEFDDTVTMVVSDVRNQLTGTYTFEVGSGAETIEEAEEVLEELDASELDEERLITLDETVLFDFGSAELKSNADLALAAVADVLGVYTEGDVRIVGHTDAVGTDEANQRLSQQRAEAVEAALADLGVEAERMTPTGSGESAPVAPNENDDGSDNPDGRAENRRVEIYFSTSD